MYYLDKIENSISDVNDSAALDHVTTLLKASTVIEVVSPEGSVLRESHQNIPEFEKKKYSPAQKMEKQLTFKKSSTPGRKKSTNLLR